MTTGLELSVARLSPAHPDLPASGQQRPSLVASNDLDDALVC
jgi:hypothetical protein